MIQVRAHGLLFMSVWCLSANHKKSALL